MGIYQKYLLHNSPDDYPARMEQLDVIDMIIKMEN